MSSSSARDCLTARNPAAASLWLPVCVRFGGELPLSYFLGGRARLDPCCSERSGLRASPTLMRSSSIQRCSLNSSARFRKVCPLSLWVLRVKCCKRLYLNGSWLMSSAIFSSDDTKWASRTVPLLGSTGGPSGVGGA